MHATPAARILIIAMALALPALARGQDSGDHRAEVFASKVGEALGIIETRYIREVNDEELLVAGIEGLYEQIGQPLPRSVASRLKAIEGKGAADHLVLLEELRKELGSRDDLEDRQDVDAVIRGMFTRLDKRSVYVDSKTVVRNRRFTVNRTSRIGVIARRDKATNEYIVGATVKDSPAHRAGVKVGDVLVELRRTPPEGTKVVVKGLASSDFNDLFVGPHGARVDLVVRRDDRSLTFHLTYEVLKLDSVLGRRRGADHAWDYYIDPSSRIAYIRIPHLHNAKTSDELKRVLADLSESGLAGLVLDLRNNAGGLVAQGTGVAEQFVKPGVITQIQERSGEPKMIRGKARTTYTDFPMICLVNGNTASSAELIAGCLQDRGRAIILGERSFGKGSMQLYLPFDGGELRLTTAHFRRPSGANLDREHLADSQAEPWGVTPDKGFEHRLSDKDQAALTKHLVEREWLPNPGEFQDAQLDAAVEWLRGRIKIREAS